MTPGAPYDPELRRETPLKAKLETMIRTNGPMPVADYMRHCLADPEHGYYRSRAGIGRDGDFITAPEITQVFGELIGLWAAVAWQQMGRPRPFTLLELGPGRGTMMRDMLRAAAVVPDFLDAVRVLLKEPNPELRSIQRATLRDARVPIEHVSDDPPNRPTIVVANEVLDCLPIAQLVHATETAGPAWRERVVELDRERRLVLSTGAASALLPDPSTGLPEPRAGDIFEVRDAAVVVEQLLGALAGAAPLAALFIDYGHTRSAYGDTLQAVRGHRPEHPLTSPGEADLTAHVDFAAFARQVEEAHSPAGFRLMATDGPLPQATFLGRLGVVERASRLMTANPARAGEIEAGVARVMAPGGMGTRFQVAGVRSAGLPRLPGFEE